MAAVLGSKKCVQICVIVKDVEEKKKKWAEFLGMPVSGTGNGGLYYITKAEYKGKPEPVANCEMGFYQLTEDISIECLQPVGGVPSEWQDFLDQHGEGLHHFAFATKHTSDLLKKVERKPASAGRRRAITTTGMACTLTWIPARSLRRPLNFWRIFITTTEEDRTWPLVLRRSSRSASQYGIFRKQSATGHTSWVSSPKS